MRGYRVEFTDRADHALEQLPDESQYRLLLRLSSLVAGGQRNRGKKLEGFKDVWAVRAGDYRAAYTINDADRSVTIEHIGHRRDFYTRLRRIPHLR